MKNLTIFITLTSLSLSLSSGALAKSKTKKRMRSTKVEKVDHNIYVDTNLGQAKTDDAGGPMTSINTGVYMQAGRLPLAIGGQFTAELGDKSAIKEEGDSSVKDADIKIFQLGIGVKAWLPKSVIGNTIQPYMRANYIPLGKVSIDVENEETIEDDFGNAQRFNFNGKSESGLTGYNAGLGLAVRVNNSLSISLEHSVAERKMINSKESHQVSVNGDDVTDQFTIEDSADSQNLKTRTNTVGLNLSF